MTSLISSIQHGLVQHPFFRCLQSVTRILVQNNQIASADLKDLASALIHVQVFIQHQVLHIHHHLDLRMLHVLVTVLLGQLKWLQGCMIEWLQAEEAFRILSVANEPYKRTRRRLPPQAESELSRWLDENTQHPYMAEWQISSICQRYSVAADQVRVFLTNARRKITDGGVRKRKLTMKSTFSGYNLENGAANSECCGAKLQSQRS